MGFSAGYEGFKSYLGKVGTGPPPLMAGGGLRKEC